MKQEGLRVGQAHGAVVKDGGQSKPYCGQYTSSCVKNQIRKEVVMDNQEPLVKGGCGHPDREIYESGLICGACGVCLCLILMLFVGIAIIA